MLRIPPKRFKELAAAVVSIFPTEVENVYYTPHSTTHENVRRKKKVGENNDEEKLDDGDGKEDDAAEADEAEKAEKVASNKLTKIVHPAGGKLLEHYRYLRALLIESKILMVQETTQKRSETITGDGTSASAGKDYSTCIHNYLETLSENEESTARTKFSIWDFLTSEKGIGTQHPW